MLTANQKYIDTANIKHLLSAGEKNADKIQIAVDRYYHQTDLSACLFTLRAVNSSGGLVMQNLEKETTENQIILTWAITEDFTAVPGQLLPEIVGQQDDTVVIKYEMTPMVVRNSILEQYRGGIDAIDKALRDMQSILSQAEQLIAKMPIIKGGTWWLYDIATGDYVDSGYPAQGDKGDTGEAGATGEKGDPGEPGAPGEKGERGEKGDPGEKGEKGNAGTPGKNGVNGKDGANGINGKDGVDGFSPVATVTETDAGATITITDKNGTTTATVKNGTNAEAALWGDYTPGWDSSAHAMYCTAKLVTVYGKQTWQILPSISTVSHNALGIVPDGLFVLDLSPDVAALKESAHTHNNKKTLDSITSDKITTWDGYSEEIQTVKNGLVGKKDQNSSYITGEIFNEYKKNKATGYASHSEGSTTTASGDCSHSEGCDTTASGRTSHAEGYFTIASGDYSHSEGFNTTASGITSHAEGNVTTASGNHSHSEGNYTIASSSYQHVQGQFNVEDSDSKYSFIIGNGKDNNNRSNAFAIDWNGKIYIGNDTDGVDVSALAITIAELQSQLNRKTIQFRHGKGTFTATATGTNVVWQYGEQQAQGSNCTFDVKSDNGLICIDFDSITSLTVSDDAALKMCLSDLGGKITNALGLSGCTSITGDLSDLGGKITNTLNLVSCTNITGDLSDLGGKITNILSLGNCTNITGIYTGTTYPKMFTVSRTSITAADMDANLINFAASGVKSGKFTAAGMKRTAASDNAVATLVANGWAVSGLTKEG